MTLPDHLFGQVRDHPLRAAVEVRRNAFVERGNLRDPHENTRGAGERSSQSRSGSFYSLDAPSLFAFHVRRSTGYSEIEPPGVSVTGRRRLAIVPAPDCRARVGVRISLEHKAATDARSRADLCHPHQPPA